ncbi:MAG: CHAP domain-containing protein [Oscillospiraceae bacterium]|nr:CHAP domain-containing protein [Oscillospiraceae bacterium]
MKTIKTKSLVEGVKTLDKAVDVSKRAKNAYIRTKETAEGTKQTNHISPTDYASDKVESTTQAVAKDVADYAVKAPKRAYDSAVRAKRQFQKARNQQHLDVKTRSTTSSRSSNIDGSATPSRSTMPSRNISPDRSATSSRSTPRSTPRATQSTHNAARASRGVNKTVRGVNRASKTVKSTAKGQIKATRRTVKTATQTGRTTIKTAQQAAKAAQKSAQAAAKAARVAAKAAKVAAKTAVKLTKLAIKAVIALVKAIIAAVKGLIAAIAAGGWVAVVVILVICLIALIVGSVFGIFFSSEPNPETGQSINSVIAEINDEFETQLDTIINSNPHDLLDMSGSRALWKHVLAIYTVRTVTDPDNPMEVAMMTDEKAQILRNVFWDINSITYEVIEFEVEVDELDDDGLPTGETYIEITTVLVIRITGKTINEISTEYGFNAEQREWLEELLKPEYNSLWNALLYGITSIGDGTMIEIAESQIGNVGGETYWQWYGFNDRVPWCACFVSWVADQVGFIEAGIIPKFASCAVGVSWFQARGQWQESGYTPAPGDLIFFDWQGDGIVDHVGIVERVEGNTVHTIEGNSSDSVRRRSYSLDSNRIFGYGIPAYNG